jgi:asparagine synthase (glutamine-hydrolysing)
VPTPILDPPRVSSGSAAHAWVAEWRPVGAPATAPGLTVFQAPEAPATLAVCADPEGRWPDVAGDDCRIVVFHGALLNRTELGAGTIASDAEVVLEVLRRGAAVPEVLRGPFAVLIWDLATGELEVARDHHGLQPLYFTRSGDVFACSPVVDALIARPGVSSALNPVALSEYLCQRYETGDGTFFRDVRRIPPGSRLRLRSGRARVETYWEPHPAGREVDWLDDEEAEQFPSLFTRAVARCAAPGSTALLLSGGLDSIAVAAEASDLARRRGSAVPLALSLGFTSDEADEQRTQARVASCLGLPQVLLPVERAMPASEVVAAALRMGAGWPVPMFNFWAVAYRALVAAGREQGVDTVMTGRGGDEWLTVSPFYAADLARAGRLVALMKLLRTRQRSYHFGGASYARHLLSNRVVRPLGSAALDRIAPGWWREQRRARLGNRAPAWLAPDPAVRAEMNARLDRFLIEARPADSFYLREARAMTHHPAIVGDLEEAHEFGRRLGVRMMHPFWDVDLSMFLGRMPPRMLMVGGRSKAPLRRLVAERLAGTDVARQRKADASGVFRNLMARDFPHVWRDMRGARCLGSLGVVDVAALDRDIAAWDSPEGLRQSGRIWEIMALESWARSHAH